MFEPEKEQKKLAKKCGVKKGFFRKRKRSLKTIPYVKFKRNVGFFLKLNQGYQKEELKENVDNKIIQTESE